LKYDLELIPSFDNFLISGKLRLEALYLEEVKEFETKIYLVSNLKQV